VVGIACVPILTYFSKYTYTHIYTQFKFQHLKLKRTVAYVHNVYYVK
jgi:hypothetical protein